MAWVRVDAPRRSSAISSFFSSSSASSLRKTTRGKKRSAYMRGYFEEGVSRIKGKGSRERAHSCWKSRMPSTRVLPSCQSSLTVSEDTSERSSASLEQSSSLLSPWFQGGLRQSEKNRKEECRDLGALRGSLVPESLAERRARCSGWNICAFSFVQRGPKEGRSVLWQPGAHLRCGNEAACLRPSKAALLLCFLTDADAFFDAEKDVRIVARVEGTLWLSGGHVLLPARAKSKPQGTTGTRVSFAGLTLRLRLRGALNARRSLGSHRRWSLTVCPSQQLPITVASHPLPRLAAAAAVVAVVVATVPPRARHVISV